MFNKSSAFSFFLFYKSRNIYLVQYLVTNKKGTRSAKQTHDGKSSFLVLNIWYIPRYTAFSHGGFI